MYTTIEPAEKEGASHTSWKMVGVVMVAVMVAMIVAAGIYYYRSSSLNGQFLNAMYINHKSSKYGDDLPTSIDFSKAFQPGQR